MKIKIAIILICITSSYFSQSTSISSIGNASRFIGYTNNFSLITRTNNLHRTTVFSAVTGAPAWYSPLPNGGGFAINLNPAIPITAPLSLLHIGENVGGGNQGGYRSWMKVGTFTALNSDQMYVGMKAETILGTERTDAVINWGDNTTTGGGSFGPDYLRFIFTAPFGVSGYDPLAAGTHGLEAMRISFNGSIGAGNYYNNSLFPFQNPARRFEILSDKTTANGNGSPLFRLTHTQQNPTVLNTTGKFAEFEPLNNGNLFVAARDNTLTNNATKNLKERFVGINTNAAGNTVEINSQLINSTTANGYPQVPGLGVSTGTSGLRFTDLKSTSIPQVNPSTSVLSIDANGDVILVQGGGSGSGFALCSNTEGGLLTDDSKIDLNEFNFNFQSNPNSTSLTKNKVSLGYICGSVLIGKFNVYQKIFGSINQSTVGGHFLNQDIANTPSLKFTGVYGNADGIQDPNLRITNIGGGFNAANASIKKLYLVL